MNNLNSMREPAAGCPARQSTRRGVTLLELMLVLALLVMLGALAYPTLRVPFQMQTLRKAGEVVRVEWGKARIKAMKSGQIQMFTFEPETGNFQVQPYYTEQSVLEADMALATGAVSTNPMAAPMTGVDPATGAQSTTLPEGCVFTSMEMEMDERAMLIQQEMQNTFGGMTSAAINPQNPPVLFYPDGTTSDARVALTNEHQRLYVVVTLRSLTGIVKVSDLVTTEEIQMVE